MDVAHTRRWGSSDSNSSNPPDSTPAATSDAESSGAATEGADGPSVALLFDVTGRGDKGYADSAAAGLDEATASHPEIVATESESKNGGNDLPDRMTLQVDNGNDLIIAVGFSWTDEVAKQDGAIRAAAHEDINFITLLPAATDTGLELMDRNGTWSAVDSEDGEIVVDSGDMLSRYLNGRIPATTHRVVNPGDGGRERYSMPFFCQPRPDVLLTPPAALLRPGETPDTEPITAGDYHRERMEQIRLRQS